MWETLHRIDWARLTHAYGWARGVPKILRDMVSHDEKARASGWDAFWGSLNHQGDFYDSTVAVIPFLIEALAHGDIPCRASILDSFRQRWLDAPNYGGDPLVEEPLGGIDEPTPCVTDCDAAEPPPDAPTDEAQDEEIDTASYRRMDLCAWQTGRAIQAGRPTFQRLLSDPDREVAAAAAELLLMWPEARPLAKRALVRTIEEEPDAAEQGRRILELGVYSAPDDLSALERWVASDRPAEVRAAAALVWAWAVNPQPLPRLPAKALDDCSTPGATAFARLPWEGVFHRGPWVLPPNAADLILRLALNKNKEIRWRAVQGLSAGRETAKHLTAAQVIPVLIQGLSDRYNRIRDAAAYALSQRAESVVGIDPRNVDAVIAALESRAAFEWGDGHAGLDDGASACGHAARLLATVSHRLDATQRQHALAGVESAICHLTGKHSRVMFDSIGVQASHFLKEQLGPLRDPREWGVQDLLESLAFPSKQDRRLSCAECDRQLGDEYSRAPGTTLAAVIRTVREATNRDAAIGGALWLMTLGPAAESALPALESMASGKLDGYAQRQAKDAAEFIRKSLTVEPDASAAVLGSARQRVAFLKEMNPPDLERGSLAELSELREHRDAYVRAAAADLLAKAAPAAGDAKAAIPFLENMLGEEAAVEVGISGPIEFEGRLYHWRRERRSPRASAVHALFALDQVPLGGRVLKALLAESVHPAVILGQCSVPHRFSFEEWCRAATAAGGLGVAEPKIRATRQQCREQGWTADGSAFATELELAEIIRQLSGRLV
jgi:hypothetical protein